MIRITMIAALLTLAGAADAQTYIATEVGHPCPPNDEPVMRQDGHWVCAVTSSLSPLENPIPKDSK
jgi:hypothetical protein